MNTSLAVDKIPTEGARKLSEAEASEEGSRFAASGKEVEGKSKNAQLQKRKEMREKGRRGLMGFKREAMARKRAEEELPVVILEGKRPPGAPTSEAPEKRDEEEAAKSSVESVDEAKTSDIEKPIEAVVPKETRATPAEKEVREYKELARHEERRVQAVRESEYAVVLSEEAPREEEKYTSEPEPLAPQEEGRNGGRDGSAADEAQAPSGF